MALSVVTTVPRLSLTATCGWVGITTPALPFDGCCVNASWVAGPATANAELSAAVSAGLDIACRL